MAIVSIIQRFLKKELKKKKISRKEFAAQSNIPYSTLNGLINGIQSNPDIYTILRIADYFGYSIDKVLNRKDYFTPKTQEFFILSVEEISANLKSFINTEVEKNQLNLYQLSKDINFGKDAIVKFIKRDSSKGLLGSEIILALANHFKVSIDKMIGRC